MLQEELGVGGKAQRAVPMTCPGCFQALPQQCQPTKVVSFLGTTSLQGHPTLLWGLDTSGVSEPELIKLLFPGLP